MFDTPQASQGNDINYATLILDPARRTKMLCLRNQNHSSDRISNTKILCGDRLTEQIREQLSEFREERPDWLQTSVTLIIKQG